MHALLVVVVIIGLLALALLAMTTRTKRPPNNKHKKESTIIISSSSSFRKREDSATIITKTNGADCPEEYYKRIIPSSCSNISTKAFVKNSGESATRGDAVAASWLEYEEQEITL